MEQVHTTLLSPERLSTRDIVVSDMAVSSREASSSSKSCRPYTLGYLYVYRNTCRVI